MAETRWLDDREAAPGHVAAVRRQFFDLLSDEEVEVLSAVFDRVLTNLEPGRRRHQAPEPS